MKQNKIDNVQYLRGFAALIVVFYHCFWSAKEYGMPSYLHALSQQWTASGVDLFFVISGFIMVYIQNLSAKTGVQFFINRILRIVPTYWVLTILLFLLMVFIPAVFRSHAADTSHFVSSLFFLSRIFEDRNPVIPLGWTLEYEFLFYTVFACTLWLRNIYRSVLVTGIALSALIIAGVEPVALEFVYGMIVGIVYIKFPAFRKYGLYIGAIGLVGYAASFGYDFYLRDMRQIIWGLPVSLIVYGAVAGPQVQSKILGFFGNASYSIYLVQWFAISPVFKIVTALKLTHLPSDLFVVIAFCVSVCAGSVFYLVFEKPVSRILKQRFANSRLSAKAA